MDPQPQVAPDQPCPSSSSGPCGPWWIGCAARLQSPALGKDRRLLLEIQAMRCRDLCGIPERGSRERGRTGEAMSDPAAVPDDAGKPEEDAAETLSLSELEQEMMRLASQSWMPRVELRRTAFPSPASGSVKRARFQKAEEDRKRAARRQMEALPPLLPSGEEQPKNSGTSNRDLPALASIRCIAPDCRRPLLASWCCVRCCDSSTPRHPARPHNLGRGGSLRTAAACRPGKAMAGRVEKDGTGPKKALIPCHKPGTAFPVRSPILRTGGEPR